MTRGKTRVLTGILALALAVTLAAPAYALGPIDVEGETGSITLKVADPGYRDDFAAQEQPAPIEVLVYKLADVSAGGVFTPTARFSALADSDAWNGGVLGVLNGEDAQADREALQTAAEELVYAGAEAVDPEAERVPALEADITASVDAAGGTIDLAASGLGLYLLIPQKTETALWVYTFNPILLAVPSLPAAREDDPEGGIPAEGDWLYDVSLDMKAEHENRLTDIVIDKTLQAYNATLGSTTFLFEVTAELNGETVYSNVVSLTFSGPGTQSVTVAGIPAGAHVTVTEVYSGGSYDVADGRASVVIESLAVPAEGEANRVAFTNTYTNERIPDGSVVNRYVYDGTGWDYQEVAGQ